MRHLFSAARVIGLLVIVSIAMETTQAQCTLPTHRARLIAYDGGTGRDTLLFGYSDSATVGLDPSLCEVEFPPFPPQGVWEARWMNPPGHEGQEPPAGLGQGVKLDFRRRVAVATIDTHRVKFQPNEPPGYPVTFKWIRTEVQGICDSCVLVDEFGGVIVPRTRMTVQDSLVVNLSAITQLLMIRYGQRLTGVEPITEGIPQTFALEQNYPNPFNPTTTIKFALERAAETDIAIYDVLGRKVSTLASGVMSAGYYTVTWNGTNSTGTSAASGIYFIRMNARADNGFAFSAIRKLLLMK